MTSSCLQTPTQFSLDITLPKFATFETYIDTSAGSLVAELKSMQQKQQQEPLQYFLWGSASTGKTHLLQAICNQFASTQQNVIYLPMKELASESAELLNVNLINELRANNKSIVLTSSINPNEANVSFADLASRLVWGPVYKLNMLEDEDKSKAIQAHAQARGLEVSDDVCNYLLKRFPRELNKLISMLDELDKQSLRQQRKVTVPFVKEVLN